MEEDEQDEEEEEDDEDGEQENGEFEVVEGADINSDDSDGAEDDEFLGGSDDEEVRLRSSLFFVLFLPTPPTRWLRLID